MVESLSRNKHILALVTVKL